MLKMFSNLVETQEALDKLIEECNENIEEKV